MHIFLVSLHVLVSAILIGMVLLQKGKGADIGAAFGGASNTVFGPRGAQSFLSKLTTGAAVLFMVTSLVLAITSAKKSSIMEGIKQEQPMQNPAIPLAPPAQQAPATVPAK
jgi:preprotein translocase subunit SecG